MRIKPNLENLVRVRKAKGITQSEMAEKLGISTATYSLKEQGKYSDKPKLEVVR